MTQAFDPRGRLVVVPVFVAGPRGGETFQFALDTGATRSAVSGLVLGVLGYSEDQARSRTTARTGSGGVSVGLIHIARFAAFGRVETDYPVIWLPLPPASRVDGLLGLDFLRGRVLTLDFSRGRVGLRAPRRWWPWG